MSAGAEQLLLGLQPRPAINFESFIVTDANATTVHALRHWLTQPQAGVFYLAGPRGAGRSHLLQAVCTEVDGALYLPLAELASQQPAALLEGLEAAPLLCLDDIDAVAAIPTWSEALFHAFNRCAAAGGKWLVSASVVAAQLAGALPDLVSRLGWGGTFALVPLDDAGRLHMLQAHARQRGMMLSDQVAAYILQRHARDPQALLELLERLDRESLRTKQRVSVNLVRKLLGEGA